MDKSYKERKEEIRCSIDDEEEDDELFVALLVVVVVKVELVGLEGAEDEEEELKEPKLNNPLEFESLLLFTFLLVSLLPKLPQLNPPLLVLDIVELSKELTPLNGMKNV